VSDPVPLSALKTLGVSTITPIGSDGAGFSKILSAAEIRAAAESYSSAQVDSLVGGRVPYSGANAAVDLGANALTCGAITASGKIRSNAAVVTSAGASGANGPSLEMGFNGYGIGVNNNGETVTLVSNVATVRMGFGVAVVASQGYAWSSGPNVGINSTIDLRLLRGGPGILHQRNGLNPQTYEIFGTYTSGTSFQSLCMKATASAMQIGSARGTSEANLPVQLGHFNSEGAFTSAISVALNGSVTLAALTHTFGYLAMTDSITLAWPGSSFGTFRAGSNGCFRIDSKAAWYSSTTGVMQARNVGNTADIDIVCAAINLTALPTSDPGVSGRVWRDGTSLKISV
jgi:hypothetical protein